jgi:septal ring factor EnvC (AmiA/AmiB activator)
VKSFRLSSCVIVAALMAVSAWAQPADRGLTEALARRATQRLQALNAEADRLAAEERSLIGDLRRLELNRQIKSEELKKTDAEAAVLSAELAETDAQVTQLQSRDAAERPELRSRVVELYKMGQGRYLRLLLSTSDVRRIGQASRMVAALAKRDRERFTSYQTRLGELTTARAGLEQRRVRIAALRAAAQQAQAAAARAIEARNALITDIDQRRDLTAQLAGELQAAQQKLQLTLRTLAAGGSTAAAARLPIRPFRGDLDWPVAGTVRHGFGSAAARRGAAASGIELAANEGTEVQAVHEGQVAFAGPFTGFGQLVIVEHAPQTFSLYGHLLEIAAAPGARVERGQPVGSVGSAPGGAAGLYFELRIDGRPVDPLQWLKPR